MIQPTATRTGEADFLDQRRAVEGQRRVGRDDAEENQDQQPDPAVLERGQQAVLRGRRATWRSRSMSSCTSSRSRARQPLRVFRLVGQVEVA